MKAKELAAAFIYSVGNNIFLDKEKTKLKSEVTEAVRSLVLQFANDLERLVTARNVGSLSSAANLLDEFNVKWNAVRRRLFKHYGIHLISKDGFLLDIQNRNRYLFEVYRKFYPEKASEIFKNIT